MAEKIVNREARAFGQRLKSFREAAGVTQSEISRLIREKFTVLISNSMYSIRKIMIMRESFRCHFTTQSFLILSTK